MDEEEILEEVDIEDVVKGGGKVPKAQRYIIRIDKKKYTVQQAVMTGRELLAEAAKSPEMYKLYQHVKGQQPKPIAPDEQVDLRESGVERFTTMPRDTTEGQGDLAPGDGKPPPRREFRLPNNDEEYLDSLGLRWETVKEGNALWLLLHRWECPQGYDHERVSLALMIPGSYPDAQIDMVYVRPGLSKANGGGIRRLSDHQMFGETWQRWSRHRTSANPWRVGEDDISTHLSLVDEWLGREVN